MPKLKFEREALGAGVPVESYSTDNAIYTSKDFTTELHDKDQGIRHNIVGVYHNNGVSDNENKNVVIIARTMMIHAALMWSDAIEKSLCTISMTHAFHLHNYTTHIFSGIPPDES